MERHTHTPHTRDTRRTYTITRVTRVRVSVMLCMCAVPGYLGLILGIFHLSTSGVVVVVATVARRRRSVAFWFRTHTHTYTSVSEVSIQKCQRIAHRDHFTYHHSVCARARSTHAIITISNPNRVRWSVCEQTLTKKLLSTWLGCFGWLHGYEVFNVDIARRETGATSDGTQTRCGEADQLIA